MMKIFLLLITLFCIRSVSLAQELKNLGVGAAWHEGNITLADGTELTGLIRNNDKEGIISFREYEDAPTTQSFRPSKIMALNYYDKDKGVNRKFYSLETKIKTSDEVNISLYEVIREFNHFAVLSYQGVVSVLESKNDYVPSMGPAGSTPPMSKNSKTVLAQLEEIYFVNENGERELYMTIFNREVDGLFDYSRTKGKVWDSSMLAKYVGDEKWNALKDYAKSIDLKINNRAKLMVLLDYYATLLD